MLKLKWNKQMYQYESDESLKKTIEEFDGYIGYVYPSNESSYYICSGGDCKLSYVQCFGGGGFYGESEICEELCIGEYTMPEPSDENIAIANALENSIKKALES